MLHIRDAEEPSYRVLFKRPPENAMAGEIYSIAMERVAYVLGAQLGLPVAAVYLEWFEGEPGAVLEMIDNAVSWRSFSKSKLRMGTLVNQALVPLYVGFDVWLANVDRQTKNILLQPVPPSVTHRESTEWKLWLIDHGYAGLWPVGKFGLTEPEALPEEITFEEGRTLAEGQIRDRMAGGFWSAYVNASDHEKQEIFDQIGALGRETVEDAVREVPDSFMSVRERELTTELLLARQDRIGELCRALE